MTSLFNWRRAALALSASAALLLSACNTPPAFQVSEPPARLGTVDSIRQEAVQNVNIGVGTVGGALLGGALGSLVGGGRGRTAATVVGAGAGAEAFAHNQTSQRSRTFVWHISVR